MVGIFKRRPVSIPERAHPLAKFIFAEMGRQGFSYDALAWKSGVLRTTFKSWRTNNRPGIETVEACLGALGWALLPVPRRETLPAAMRVDLEAIATKYALNELPVLQLMATCTDYGWRQSVLDRQARGSLHDQPLEAAA